MPEAIFQQVKGYQAAIRRFEKIITREQVARRVGILVQAVAQRGTKQGRFKQAQVKPEGLPRVVALAQSGKYGGTSKTDGHDIGARYDVAGSPGAPCAGKLQQAAGDPSILDATRTHLQRPNTPLS